MILTSDQISTIPEELRLRPQWVNFHVAQDESGKFRKIPRISGTDLLASSTHPETWRSFAEASLHPYPAFTFTSEDPYVFIDLDQIFRMPHESDAVWTTRVQKNTVNHAGFRDKFGPNAYVEESVSGNGTHIIGRGVIGPGIQVEGLGIYDRDRFCIFTGIGSGAIGNLDTTMLEIVVNHFRRPSVTEAGSKIKLNGNSPHKSDEEIIRIILSRPRAKILWEGRWAELVAEKEPGQDRSPSAFDYEFLAELLELTRDEEQTTRLFQASGMMREEKTTPSYIQRTLRKSTPQIVQRLEFADQVIKSVKKATRRKKFGTGKKIQPAPGYESGTDLMEKMPGGIIRDICDELFRNSMYPIPEVCMMTAVAMGAMLFQRAYTGPDDKSLNLYLLLLAKSSAGKAPFTTMIPTLLRSCGTGVLERMWQGEQRSEQALFRSLQASPRMVMVKTEADAWFSSMSSGESASWEKAASSVFTSVWSMGTSCYTPPRRGKDEAGELMPVSRPCLSIIAETQPESLYSGLGRMGLDRGFFPRFITMEVPTEEIPREKNPNRSSKFSDKLIHTITEILEKTDKISFNDQTLTLSIDPEAEKIFDKFCAIMRESLLMDETRSYIAAIFGKLGENSIKLASIFAAANQSDTGEGKITNEMIQWSIGFVCLGASRCENNLMDSTSMEAGSNVKIDAIIRQIDRLHEMTGEQKRGTYRNFYGGSLADHPQLIPITLLKNRLSRVACFAKSPSGEIDRLLAEMVRDGIIHMIANRDSVKTHTGAGTACVVVNQEDNNDACENSIAGVPSQSESVLCSPIR